MKRKISQVGIVIPARNEEKLLPRCLDSVIDACLQLSPEVAFDIIVAVDCSTDKTLAIATRMLRGYGVAVVTDAGAVGCARALAADVLLRRYRGPLDRCWLANTDADCSLPSTWLIDQLRLADEGVDAIAGTIDIDSFAEHDPGVDQRFRDTYLIHTDGSHPHVHGANLGVRASAYQVAGGWGTQSTAEDHDLWGRLRLSGAQCVSAASLRVLTSGRRVGRAPFGFADALAAHNTVSA
jgi:glycosyltransferase involved in cell wall biosynthesis